MQNNSWQDNFSKDQRPSAPTYETPMKWHKFLIYFSLWAGGILNVVTGVTYLTGSVYGYDQDYIYRYFDGLKAIDVLYGLALIAVGVMLIVTRFQLAGYKASGPNMLMFCYIGTTAISVIYSLFAAGIIGTSLMSLINPGSLVASIAMIFINKNYYDKRAHLFVY